MSGGRSKYKPFKRPIRFGFVLFIGERKRSRSNGRVQFGRWSCVVGGNEPNMSLCVYKVSIDMNLTLSISCEFIPLTADTT